MALDTEPLGALQHDEAAERVAARAAVRRGQIETLGEPGGVARADTPERVAKRVDRLSRTLAGELAETGDAAGTVLERIINSTDYVGVRYLEAGMRAARCVARVDLRDATGHDLGYGTGSMVSPRLLLTNWHVLGDAETARRAAVEFDYEDGLDGQPRRPVAFGLDPDAFFLADRERDFALVAVAAGESALAPFGFNPLIAAEGKAIIGDFVTIVQHPGGRKKQVALRENRVVDVLDRFLHYATDTEPGSSGAPVFNDQWEVVALHHAGVASPAHGELGGFVNEGVRVSRIVAFARAQALPADAHALLAGLALSERVVISQAPSPALAEDGPPAVAPGVVRVTVPLEITVHVGAPAPSVQAAVVVPDAGEEAVSIDPDYATRKGYDAGFLGAGAHRVALPTLPPALLAQTARLAGRPGAHLLRYHHYSVVLSRVRRLAFFTAVNIDGARTVRLLREPDRWHFDPRLALADQTGEAVYAGNDLDRGHLVRRLDPAWASPGVPAKVANDDTFHFTNCTPQHKRFNEGAAMWAGLEDYILDHADNLDFKASVITGPVLADDDDAYRGVQLPRQFWKVVAMVKAGGALSATAYLLSQAQLIAGLETTEPFDYGAYRTFQVPVTRIEALTQLSFGALAAADPLAGLESTGGPREIAGPPDLLL